MRSLGWILLIGASLAATSGRAPAPRVIEVSNSTELIAALNGTLDRVTINLAPGTYELTPRTRLVPPEPSGLTDDAMYRSGHEDESISVRVGAVVSGRNITLEGSPEGETVIRTHAGYGIYLEHCKDCAIERVTISGGVVDSLQRSGDGAVVVRESSARVRNCVIKDNYDVVGTEFGIAGICVREGGVLKAEFNEIACLSAPAVSIFDGGVTSIQNNLIKGGIQATGKYRAVIEKNLITQQYWGIRAGGGSLEIRGNIIETVSMQGIFINSSRDAAVDRNVVFDCGGVGIYAIRAIYSAGQLRVTRNLIVATGVDPFSKENFSVPPLFIHWSGAIDQNNTCYANAARADSLNRDVPREAFWRARRSWTRTYRNTAVGVDGRHKFYESAFLTRYGKWAD
jgi:hypothetical protein